jgi:hypothetical protein
MKAKKLTLTSRALDLLKHTPNMKPKDMAEKLGVPVQRIYALRSNLKNKPTKKTVSNVTNEQQISRPVNYMLNLEHENKRLTEWTLMWKQKYEKLEQDYTEAKIMFLNSQAVVEYLENKVANLLRGK